MWLKLKQIQAKSLQREKMMQSKGEKNNYEMQKDHSVV